MTLLASSIITTSLFFSRHYRTFNLTVIFLFLGSEKNYVILSLVRSLPEHEIERNPSRSWLMEKLGFITDEHQINVALTRAKRGLCIIGKIMSKRMFLLLIYQVLVVSLAISQELIPY